MSASVRTGRRPAGSSDPSSDLDWVKRFSLSVVHQPLLALQPAARHARTHSRKQVRQIAASIQRFGFVNPVLVDGDGQVIAGHGRIAAAKLLGLAEVPVIRLDHLTPEQTRAYALADNRLAELAGWDDATLAAELKELSALDLSFDVEITGFDTGDIDRLISTVDAAGADAVDVVPEPETTAVTRAGDLWLLGQHRLLCGNACDAEAFRQLLDGAEAQLVFTDPPYNVPIQGHVSGLGKVRHREFAMASGEMAEADFTRFLTTVLGNMAAASADGSIHFVCMDWRHMKELLKAGGQVYTELKNLCVWNKDSGGIGAFYRSKHELVFVFKKGTAPHINTFGLGEKGRYRTNVWDYPGANSFHHGRAEELALHPTVKPMALVMDAIKDCSRRGGIILDAFGGSGTTLIAAEKTGRRGRLMEIDPLYVDVIIRRWQALTGNQARLAETGETFAEVAQRGTAARAEGDGRG
jgi:DNA modification methylase